MSDNTEVEELLKELSEYSEQKLVEDFAAGNFELRGGFYYPEPLKQRMLDAVKKGLMEVNPRLIDKLENNQNV